MRSDLVIECHNLTKVYEKRRRKHPPVIAVNDIDLEVPRNTIYGYLGPNGAGKSTTMKMLIASLRPTKGTIKINGFDLETEKSKALASVGYIPENATAYFQDVAARKFVEFMGQLRGLPKEKAKRAAQEQLLFVGLEEHQDKLIGKMSEGQKQRVGLAQVLVNNPEILIMDEPTANLDPLGKVEVAKLFEELRNQGKTLFISSHLLAELQAITDMICVINKGSIVIAGTVDELLERFQTSTYLIRVDNPESLIERLKRTVIVSEIITEGNNLIIKATDPKVIGRTIPVIVAEEKLVLYEFKPLMSPLERIFFGTLEISPSEEQQE